MKMLLSTLLLFTSLSYGYETDQYSSLGLKIEDSEPEINQLVNKAIKFTAENWVGEKDSYKFAMGVVEFFDKRQLERYTNISPSIDHHNPKQNSIYQYVSGAVSPIIRYKVLASTININGVHIGADKMSHFFGVGSVLLTRYTETLPEGAPEYGELDFKALQKALDRSVFTEYVYWGMLTTGVYSNSDLVVNYEGLRFLLGLFVDNIIPGNRAIIKWDGNRPIVVGEFDFSDYVNDYWSEALNPNRLKYGLHGKVKVALQSKCFDDSLVGAVLRSPNDEELSERYSELLNLTPNRYSLLMDNVCSEVDLWNEDQYLDFSDEISKLEKKHSGVVKDSPLDEPKLESLIENSRLGCRKTKIKAKNEHMMMLLYDRTFSKMVFTQLEKSIENSSVNKMCTSKTLDLESDLLITRNKTVTLAINYCVERDNATLKRSRYYSYEKRGRVLHSMEGYINFDDTTFYVLRTSSVNCNWY